MDELLLPGQLMVHRRPPRLPHSEYIGPVRIFFTMCTFERRARFTTSSSVDHANLMVFASRFKQASGYAYRRCYPQRLWQEGYYDRVLRAEEDALEVARYVVSNPVRAGLCTDVREYPYLGSQRYSIEELVGSLA
jgi:hypothetical protein